MSVNQTESKTPETQDIDATVQILATCSATSVKSCDQQTFTLLCPHIYKLMTLVGNCIQHQRLQKT